MQAEEHATHTGQRGSKKERDHDHAIDVDAHEGRRLAVLGGGPHRAAEPRAEDERVQRNHQGHRHHEEHQSGERCLDTPGVDERLRDEGVARNQNRRRADPDLDGALEKERDADGGDERRQAVGIAQRAVSDSLDPDAKEAGATHRRHHHQGDGQPRRHGRHLVMDEHGSHPSGKERADHEHVAMREIQHLEDAVDERVSEGDQGVKASKFQPVDELLQEGAHGNQKGDGSVPSPSFLLLSRRLA